MKLTKLNYELREKLHAPYVQISVTKIKHSYVAINHYEEEVCRDTNLGLLTLKLNYFLSVE